MLLCTCISFHSLVVSSEGLVRSNGILTVQRIGVLWVERLFKIRGGRNDFYTFHLIVEVIWASGACTSTSGEASPVV